MVAPKVTLETTPTSSLLLSDSPIGRSSLRLPPRQSQGDEEVVLWGRYEDNPEVDVRSIRSVFSELQNPIEIDFKNLLNHEIVQASLTSGLPKETVDHLLASLSEGGVVNPVDLGCTAVLLSNRSGEEKVGAIFTLIDSDGDGYVSPDELAVFLSCTYKLTLTREKAKFYGINSIHSLVATTVHECLRTLDLNGDNRLSKDEFMQFLVTPKFSPLFV
jgi:Ca2+-binding EF-hand superfamily protein